MLEREEMLETEDELDNEEETAEVSIVTLTAEDGEEHEFYVIGDHVLDGVRYFALLPTLIPTSEENPDEARYFILKLTGDGDDEMLESIEDEEELKAIATYFDSLFSELLED